MKVIIVLVAVLAVVGLSNGLVSAAFDPLENNAVVQASKAQCTRIPYKNGFYCGQYDPSK